ncbi:MAG: tRNA preQ1(34) S-adenosylmethionine ribosyltransferase-isomerase QueA, partial [candidate division Zixibacteria bacterium]|nr:tRNA preQ1(34) S-adenosylmethionine ribosyltransferase-isomerase QueA [candidate division Zixibacteria bacterium]
IVPFTHLVDYLKRGDALVVNTTKVFKARLFGRRPTGAKVEVFLVRRITGLSTRKGHACPWEAMVRPSRRVKEGERVIFDSLHAILAKDLGGGRWAVEFPSKTVEQKIIAHFGHVPLPHYIKRDDQPSDIRRYQTIFADPDKIGAVAAPTAGFHFTRPILDTIRARGARLVEVCLHVGPGTFKPVTADNIDDHVVDPELAELSPQAARSLNQVRQKGGRVFAVGTTSVRTLESARIVDGRIQPFAGEVDLYIRPGFAFGVTDHLVTNFHLPKSSLIILVSAFAGRERVLDAYRQAIALQMRFYSYGDAMLIL